MATYRTLAEALARGTGRERAFCCPVHGDTHASASVNVLKGKWTCYVCGAKGTTTDIIESDDYEFGRQMLDLLDAAEPTIYPESWLDLFHRPGEPHPYWLQRFTPEAVDHFRLGYNPLRVVRGEPAPAPCYPMRDPTGKILGVVYRQIDRMPKYVYPTGVSKSGLLFNYSMDHQPYLVLVEGALDAVAVWESGHPAVALYGSLLHRNQLELLHRAAPDRIILALDNDPAGKRAVEGWITDEGERVPGLDEQLSRAGFDVARIDWAGRPEKDIAELSKDLRTSLLDPLAP